MRNSLDAALAEVAKLPIATQDRIGRDLLAHVDHLRALRQEIDLGIRSLDAGAGRAIDIEDVIRRARDDATA